MLSPLALLEQAMEVLEDGKPLAACILARTAVYSVIRQQRRAGVKMHGDPRLYFRDLRNAGAISHEQCEGLKAAWTRGKEAFRNEVDPPVDEVLAMLEAVRHFAGMATCEV